MTPILYLNSIVILDLKDILVNIYIINLYGHDQSFQSLLAFILVITIIIGINPTNTVLSQPIIKDTKLKAEIFAQGLKSPTSMAFLGPKDILVIEKEDGTVKRIVNGSIVATTITSSSCCNKK